MKTITITVSDQLYEGARREARERGHQSAEDYLVAALKTALQCEAQDFTACEDKRFLLDPGGGLALAEDFDDQDLKEETRPWRRGKSGRRTGR
tara:strand:- start:56815 stop:57093 length:279 start_codon:yes stop_codon:yes gene_type:complete